MSNMKARPAPGDVNILNVLDSIVSPVSVLGTDTLSQLTTPAWADMVNTASFLADTKTIDAASAISRLGIESLAQFNTTPAWADMVNTASFLVDAKPAWWTTMVDAKPWWTSMPDAKPWWTAVQDSVETIDAASAISRLGIETLAQLNTTPAWADMVTTASFLVDTKPAWWTTMVDAKPWWTTVLDSVETTDAASAVAGTSLFVLGNLVDSIREQADSSTVIDDAEELFGQISGTEGVLAQAAEALDLTVPFRQDRAVRAALQIVVTAAVAATLFGISMLTHPMITIAAGLLAAYGTPKSTEVWKATGAAYDRLYGEGSYHPDRAVRGEPARPTRGPDRNSKW